MFEFLDFEACNDSLDVQLETDEFMSFDSTNSNLKQTATVDNSFVHSKVKWWNKNNKKRVAFSKNKMNRPSKVSKSKHGGEGNYESRSKYKANVNRYNHGEYNNCGGNCFTTQLVSGFKNSFAMPQSVDFLSLDILKTDEDVEMPDLGLDGSDSPNNSLTSIELGLLTSEYAESDKIGQESVYLEASNSEGSNLEFNGSDICNPNENNCNVLSEQELEYYTNLILDNPDQEFDSATDNEYGVADKNGKLIFDELETNNLSTRDTSPATVSPSELGIFEKLGNDIKTFDKSAQIPALEYNSFSIEEILSAHSKIATVDDNLAINVAQLDYNGLFEQANYNLNMADKRGRFPTTEELGYLNQTSKTETISDRKSNKKLYENVNEAANRKTKRQKPQFTVNEDVILRVDRYWEVLSKSEVYFNLTKQAIPFFSQNGIEFIKPDFFKRSAVACLLPNGVKIENFNSFQTQDGWIYEENKKRAKEALALRWCGQKQNFYDPFIVRYKVKDGKKYSKEGLCPYCPFTKTLDFNTIFHTIQDSSYMHHVCKDHGVYSSGYEMLPPVIGKTDGKTVAYCSECGDLCKISLNASPTDFSNSLIAYFRHSFVSHNKKKQKRSREQKQSDHVFFNCNRKQYLYEKH